MTTFTPSQPYVGRPRPPHPWLRGLVRAIEASRWVHSERTLLRSAALLHDRDTLTVPADIPPLVQAATGPPHLALGLLRRDAGGPASRRACRLPAPREGRGVPPRRGGCGPKATLDGWVKAGVGDADIDRAAPARCATARSRWTCWSCSATARAAY
jgi:CRISPR-associated endonuclease/helicase Cas3